MVVSVRCCFLNRNFGHLFGMLMRTRGYVSVRAHNCLFGELFTGNWALFHIMCQLVLISKCVLNVSA